METKHIIKKLYEEHDASKEELAYLLHHLREEDQQELFDFAYKTRERVYGTSVYVRGLIEISNYCQQDCMYCGIRRSNGKAQRYRLSKAEILACCEQGYALGYRTFVLQGGEDPYFSDEVMCDIISSIKQQYPDVAITLSIGERSEASYQKMYDAGGDRYLLRHESATRRIYEALHPTMSFDHRRSCLHTLKKIGYQTGAGFLIGLPQQGIEDYVDDLRFLKTLQPHMVGLGPFIPQQDTPLKAEKGGSVEWTLILLALVRLLLPEVLLPATTALGTLDPNGREKGFKVGANVIMPNLSPYENRKKYALYDGKKFISDEAAEELKEIQRKVEAAGFQLVMERGDHITWKKTL